MSQSKEVSLSQSSSPSFNSRISIGYSPPGSTRRTWVKGTGESKRHDVSCQWSIRNISHDDRQTKAFLLLMTFLQSIKTTFPLQCSPLQLCKTNHVSCFRACLIRIIREEEVPVTGRGSNGAYCSRLGSDQAWQFACSNVVFRPGHLSFGRCMDHAPGHDRTSLHPLMSLHNTKKATCLRQGRGTKKATLPCTCLLPYQCLPTIQYALRLACSRYRRRAMNTAWREIDC